MGRKGYNLMRNLIHFQNYIIIVSNSICPPLFCFGLWFTPFLQNLHCAFLIIFFLNKPYYWVMMFQCLLEVYVSNYFVWSYDWLVGTPLVGLLCMHYYWILWRRRHVSNFSCLIFFFRKLLSPLLMPVFVGAIFLFLFDVWFLLFVVFLQGRSYKKS